MNIGPLDKRGTFKEKSVAQDSATGYDVVSWVEVDTVWMNVQDVMPSRDESVTQGLQVSAKRARVRIRWRNDLDSSMRIELTYPTARVLQIIGGPAEIGGRKGYLEFMCEQVST
jgi:SPP1 family predicted phage head-tail adaptor